jgi:hypothetical protein
MLQVDFADHPDAVRKEYLVEEIKRATDAVSPEQRRSFLEQLQEKFPAWDMTDVSAPVGTSAVDAAELNDWTFLVDRLTALAKDMSPQARQTAIDRLTEAGLGATGKTGWPPQLNSTIKTKLQMGAAEELQPIKAGELLDMLVEFSAGLDLLAWNTWKTVAPQSSTRRKNPLQKLMGRFAAGDAEFPRSVVLQEVGALRKLIAAIISAVGQVGRKFAEDYVVKYSPAQIEDLVKAQGGMFGNQKAKCWEKYVQMSASLDANGIEHEIMASVADYAEALMRGIGR